MPSQVSLIDQFRALIPIATQKGLYDAADYLRNKVEFQEKREKREDDHAHEDGVEITNVQVEEYLDKGYKVFNTYDKDGEFPYQWARVDGQLGWYEDENHGQKQKTFCRGNPTEFTNCTFYYIS